MSVSGTEVVARARGWLGTRFHHQGRLKKSGGQRGGVDCLGLLVGVAAELELNDRHGRPFGAADVRDYCHLPNTQKLRDTLLTVLDEVPVDDVAPGDVLLMDVDGRAQHLGIVTDWCGGLGIIHAYAPARAVVEHALDGWWRGRVVLALRVL